ncbi:hypothetical protein ABIC63_005636 [Pseudacidovorax sp. 1753]|uniref:hypothetical protein n=1 Tax=Pseudacidovorax sp. 1753 TaxID=3156419 RepID=UPI003390A46A
MSADHIPAAAGTADPFAAFEQTPALLAACQALTPAQFPNDSERMFAAFSTLYDADPADPSMIEDLAKFCDGWQAAKSDERAASNSVAQPCAAPAAVPIAFQSSAATPPPSSYVAGAGIIAADGPGVVVQKLDAAFRKATKAGQAAPAEAAPDWHKQAESSSEPGEP